MNSNYKYKGMYIFTYAPIGILCPLIGQYLKSIGFSGTQIGTITALGTGASILAGIMWGKIYANCEDGKIVVFLLCIMSGIVGYISSLTTIFFIYTVLYAIMYFFQQPVMALTDAMVIGDGKEFSSIRLWGSAGYASATFIAGKICETFGLDKIFLLYAITFFIGGLFVISTKKQKKVAIKEDGIKTDKISFLHLLEEKKAIKLIICGFFIFGTNVANNTYFGFLFNDGGGTVAGIGLVFLLMVGSEVPFMALTPKFVKIFSMERLIAISILISILRFTWYSTGPSYQLLLWTFFLQGMVNGVLLVEYIRYIFKVVNIRLIGIAISAFYVFSSSVGTIFCTYFGGRILDSYGSTGVYGYFAISNAIGLILYMIFGLYKVEKTK